MRLQQTVGCCMWLDVSCTRLMQVRMHNLMLASDSPRSALKISDFEYSKTEQVWCSNVEPRGT